MKLIVGIAALSAALAVPAAAQTKSPAANPASTKKTAASPDIAFAREAAIGGMAEVELGNLAKEKASSPDVKSFADRMVTDHTRAGDELKQWAQSRSIVFPPELDSKHKMLRDRLARLSGDAFDKAYMREMLSDHQQDVAAFKHEATSGKDPDLKAWARKTLPTLQEHLKLAQSGATKAGASTAAKGRGGK